jgi:hypothetical protein
MEKPWIVRDHTHLNADFILFSDIPGLEYVAYVHPGFQRCTCLSDVEIIHVAASIGYNIYEIFRITILVWIYIKVPIHPKMGKLAGGLLFNFWIVTMVISLT